MFNIMREEVYPGCKRGIATQSTNTTGMYRHHKHKILPKSTAALQTRGDTSLAPRPPPPPGKARDPQGHCVSSGGGGGGYRWFVHANLVFLLAFPMLHINSSSMLQFSISPFQLLYEREGATEQDVVMYRSLSIIAPSLWQQCTP